MAMAEFVEIIDRFGRRRRARPGEIPADGESIHIPATFMDARARELADYLGQKYGRRSEIVDGHGFEAGHRPGHLYNTDQHLRDAADAARAERVKRLQNAWRSKYAQDHGGDSDDCDHVGARTLDQARAVATDAYEDKRVRISNSWKNR
jgi:hypothetical protein